MPNCFSLTRRTEIEKGAVPLQQVDEELCAFLGVRCDEKEWYHGWYGYIGFLIAMGKTWDRLKADIAEKVAKSGADTEQKEYWLKMEQIRDWLEREFTSDAWAEIERR